MSSLKVDRLRRKIWFVDVRCTGSASSSNPNLFPQNLTNYYTNVFNPNVNTQFLQNANVPSKDNGNPYVSQQFFGPMNPSSIGIPVRNWRR